MTVPDREPRPLDHLTLRGRADAVAIDRRDGALSYAGLEEAVGSLAGWLVSRGLTTGDRVASWLPKTRLALLLPLATARAGLIHVPVNPLLKRAQVAHILVDSGARLLLSQAPRLATLSADDVPSGCAAVTEDEAAGAGAPALPPSDVDPETLAALLYTSGSTGRPKGVMLTHANLWLGAVSVAHYLALSPADRVLAVLPLAFDYGQNQLLSTWHAGGTVIPIDYLVARDVLRAVERWRPTTLAGVPPLWTQLCEISWPSETSLERLTNSGGALTPALIGRLQATFPGARIHAMYGLTEAFRSTSLDPALLSAHPESIGTAIPFAEISVRTPDGGIAADGEPGELVHAGPLVARGYWRDPERSAARFRPEPDGSLAVWSGDTVVRDADGLLRFVGREDEMIKTAGNRVSPTEVEAAAVASGATTEAVAIGVADARLGQSILLVAAGAPDDRLQRHLAHVLPAFMQPREIRWLDVLPRNPNGKIDRAALKREAQP
ncbi:acyl-CoA ligase (AMP-forming) (exosortase A-associated) [Sphingomonas jejuensis]|uniref:Acyl-CoA ligase (AMP-forming) (Exosortase A-associated) n=1 Tax=Sphingomonas jejuensis TaxID=904715 RepID=A0ABX0XJG6_9SPHN|nr:AMP-binding protein [Sphingomonas jejuensis]NJC33308.1 acyl-CoA ligase (AMP-forming) (exosortase A-associated) [Sphingomonas jejuensis]